MSIKKQAYLPLILFFLLLNGQSLFAQAPSFISYQGVARNAQGQPVNSSSIAISFELRQGTANSSPVFSETQVVVTNDLGLFSTKIGTANPTAFNAVNWQQGALFLQIGIDVNVSDGISYSDLGVQEVASVPFAFHAQSVPSSYTNNILSIGNATYALLTPQTLTAGAGIAINSSSIVNTAPDQTVNLSQGSNIVISGTYPDFTITAQPQLSLNGNDLSISGGNTVTIAPTLSLNGNTLSVGPATNTISLPVATTPSISGAGIASVSPASGYNFTVAVAQPTFAYSNSTGSLTSGTSSAYITPSIGLNGNTLTVGPNTNSVALPTAATPSIAGAGIATVSPASGYNFTVSVQTPSFTNTGQNIITGTYPNFSVNTPTVPTTPSVSAAGIATVSAGPNYLVGVPTPSFTNTGQNIVTGTYPNYSVNTPTVANTDIVLTTTAAAGPSLTSTGTNSFALNIPATQAWGLTGNAGTTPTLNFIGTSDNTPLFFRVNSQYSGAIDQNLNNAFFGYQSGSSVSTASLNAGFGQEALRSITTANRNSAFGYHALRLNTGFSNTGIGASALSNNTTGGDNTALGKDALYQNSTSSFNLAAGSGALLTHTLGDNNVALGRDALNNNAGGADNVAIGSLAGYSNNGSGNVFIGYNAGYNETGSGKFYLANTSTTATPLLYGNFTSNFLGIGTTTANAPLQFANSISGRKIVLWEGSNNDHQVYGFGINSNVLRYQVDASVADHVFYSGINSSSSLELLRITGTGNVGIGTSAPTANLHVNGTMRLVDGNQGLNKVLTSDASGNASWQTPVAGWGLTGSAGTSTANFLGTSDAQNLSIRTNSVQRVLITSAGLVGFGSGYTPGAPVVMQGQSANAGILKLYNSNGTSGDQTFIGFNVSAGFDNFDIARIGSERSGGGGEGRLTFSTGSINAQFERMRIDEFGKIGMGTSSPSTHLDVWGSESTIVTSGFAAAPSSAIRIHNDDLTNNNFSSLAFSTRASNNSSFEAAKIVALTTNHTIGSQAGDLAIMTRNASNLNERMRITSTGFVGIGTNAPSALLTIDVASVTANSGIQIKNARDEIGAGLPLNIEGVTSGQTYSTNTYGRLVRLTNTTLNQFYDFGIASNSNLFITNGNNYSPAALYISNTGNVGISIPSPAQKLHVNGNISLDDATAGSAPARTIGFPTGTAGNHGALTIQAKSNVFSGTAYVGGNLILAAGDFNLSAAANSNGGEVIIRGGRNSFDGTGGGNIIFQADGNAYTERMRIEGVSGNVGIGTNTPGYQLHLSLNSAAKPGSNAWTIPSDGTLKTNVHDYKDGLKELMSIQPVWYTYTGEAGMPRETFVGVIAQDLQKIAPYMVKEWTYRSSPSENGKTYLGVDNGSMTYMMINAIKEQQQQIEDLKKTIEAQQKQIDALQK